MKRCFAIVVLSVFLITYLLPVATLVKADVVIGDYNEVIVNENAHILGRKLALMESIPNLLNNGVTSLSISNVSDLDEYLDSLWDELGDAVDYLTTGDWAQDISNELRNEALENITNYINYIGNRENIFANLLRDPATTLLKEYVLGNNLPKTEYKPYNNLNAFKRLSQINNAPSSPVPSEYRDIVDQLTSWYVGSTDISTLPLKGRTSLDNIAFTTNMGNFCMLTNYNADYNFMPNSNVNGRWYTSTIGDILITSNNDDTYNVAFQNFSNYAVMYGLKSYPTYFTNSVAQAMYLNSGYLTFQLINASWEFPQINGGTTNRTLTSLLNSLVHQFRHINLYVDGVQWGYSGETTINPQLDIDGFLTIYGDDNPPQYDILNDTKIDYDELYDTIYNAIVNALPIDQQDITYYDSHDTIYSPTIINNYGSDTDGESDWIESILDYAIVPEFDTALVEPLSEPITNGTVVMVTGVSVFPQDILFVLGAAFVLILFACIINRMIE